MPHIIGTVDDSNGRLAHYNLLQVIHDFTSSNGWEVLRYDTTKANRELIIKGKGYSGQEQIYLCFYTYQSETADYYNIAMGTAIGYVAGNPITTQPNVIFSGVPAHNRRIDYWLSLSPQRITGLLRVGTPVYESFYCGKCLPYALPNQYPLPLVCGGMLYGASATRFSDTNHSMPYKGNRANFRLFFNSGAWLQPEVWPWVNTNITSTSKYLRSCNQAYTLQRLILTDSNNLYGELEGIAHISGFDNAVENTLVIDGVTWVIGQDVSRTGVNDYYAMRLDA